MKNSNTKKLSQREFLDDIKANYNLAVKEATQAFLENNKIPEDIIEKAIGPHPSMPSSPDLDTWMMESKILSRYRQNRALFFSKVHAAAQGVN